MITREMVRSVLRSDSCRMRLLSVSSCLEVSLFAVIVDMRGFMKREIVELNKNDNEQTL